MNFLCASDVTTAENGCFAAVGDGVADDTAAIQSHIDYMAATYGGGIVGFPPRKYIVGGDGLIVSKGVRLIGASRAATYLQQATDNSTVTFDASTGYAELSGIFVQGYQGAKPTRNTIEIAPGVCVFIRDCNIWGGLAAIHHQGVDGTIQDSFICGQEYGIYSTGANWYIRVKLDTVGYLNPKIGFTQSTSVPPTRMENHLLQCDFSGNFEHSLILQDASNEAMSCFQSCVFSSPITISGAKWSNFIGCEFGSQQFQPSAGSAVFTGCTSFAPLSVPGAIDGGGNINIAF
jgi:hypothetical protein